MASWLSTSWEGEGRAERGKGCSIRGFLYRPPIIQRPRQLQGRHCTVPIAQTQAQRMEWLGQGRED